MPLDSPLMIALSNASPLTGEAVKRFSQLPVLRSVASYLVAQALARLTPPVTLDPGDVALGWPPEVSPTGQTQHLALPDLLVDLFARGDVLTIVKDYQVALHRQGEHWVPMKMDLGRLAEELDAVRPSLELAFGQALAAYWSAADIHGKTNWAWMGDYLREAFAHALETARLTGKLPSDAYSAAMRITTRTARNDQSLAADGIIVLATLVQLEEGELAVPFDARLDPQLLLTLTQSGTERFIAYSPAAGLRWLTSSQALLADFNHGLGHEATFADPHIRRLSVEGDIFNAMARTFLQTQLIQVRRFVTSLPQRSGRFAGDALKVASDGLTGLFMLDAQVKRGTNRWLQMRLPEWLRMASVKDRWQYAVKLAQAALTKPMVERNWFLDGIPSLEAYAVKRLGEEAARMHPEGPPLQAENIEASRVYVEQDLVAAAGGPWEPSLGEAPVDVVELAINNLSSQSLGWLKVVPKPNTTLPAWLDGDALKGLIRSIDVGGTYPRVLRERLLEGLEATRRRGLFCRQVVMQLPLLAWELVLKGHGDMDRKGYELVMAGVGARPTEDTTRLMALGVTPGETYGVDQIAATYVFIRENEPSGCCVLYRPLNADQLRQYASLDALWEDLTAPGDLQDEALRWMTDEGRTRYSQGGWREPHVTRFGQGDEFAPINRPAPARPKLTPLGAPVLETLYSQVVAAIIDQAERRSISNAEDTWISLGKLSWTLFNGLLPVFNGPLSAAGWLIQLSDQFANYLEVKGKSAGDREEARNDLLFSIVLLLVSEGVHWPIDEPQGPGYTGDGLGGGEITQLETEDGSFGPWHPSTPGKRPQAALNAPAVLVEPVAEQKQGHKRPQALEVSWSSAELALDPRQQRALVALKASAPQHGLTLIPHGTTQGLYLHQDQLLVKWQDDFYAVNLEDDAPRIVGPDGQPGPYLRRDETGRWVLDLRLRLLGGGPKRRIEARRRQNEQIRAQAEQIYGQVIPLFDTLRNRANALAEELERAVARGDRLVEGRQALDQVLSKGHSECLALIDSYQALQTQTPLTEFAERQCLLLERLLSVSKSMIENLVELSRDLLQESPLFHVNAAEFEKNTMADPSAWRAFLEQFEQLLERTATDVQTHHRTAERLAGFPGLGGQLLIANADKTALSVSLPHLWSSLAYCRLAKALEPLRDFPTLAAEMYAALDPVLVHSASHADALEDANLTVQEQIKVFDTAALNYQRGEDAAQAFVQTLAPEHRSAALQKFVAVTVALREDAERRMGQLIRSETTEQAGPSRRQRRPPARPRPQQGAKPGNRPGGQRPATAQDAPGSDANARVKIQVIHTADGEAIMAHVRAADDSQSRVAEVLGNGRVLASWRQDSPAGPWQKVDAAPLATPQETVRLNTLIRESDQALAAAQRELRELRRLKQATRLPADIEDLYHSRAQRLEELAEQIERALTRVNATDAPTEERNSAQVKSLSLRSQAAEARRVGTTARIELSKSLLPTAGRVDFLLQAGEVSISRLGSRAQLQREGRRDYVQEYEIVDRDRRPLWYAHFHYDTLTAAPERYTAAHLKTVTQRYDGYQLQLQQARNDQEVVGIYRSRIDPVLARKLFLSLP